MTIKLIALAFIGFVAAGLINEAHGDEKKNNVYYVAIPRCGTGEESRLKFSAICMKWPGLAVENGKNTDGRDRKISIGFWRIFPLVAYQGGEARQKKDGETLLQMGSATSLDEYPNLPYDVGAILGECLRDFRKLNDTGYFQPLFPEIQATAWLQTDTLNVYIENSTASSKEREDSLISQLKHDVPGKYKSDGSFSNLFKEMCFDMAVPAREGFDVWYIAKHNILIIRGNDDFGGLMEALFGIM